MATHNSIASPSAPPCACGCGQHTSMVAKTSTAQGYVKGEYMRRIVGHSQRGKSNNKGTRHKPLKFCSCGTRLRNRGATLCRTCRTEEQRSQSADIFWSHVDRSSDCWLWTRRCLRGGYGTYGGTTVHRYAWQLTNGTIPDGLECCHRCDIRNCVRPDHLFLGTHKANMSDCCAKGRMHRGESGNHVLTESQVREIRALAATNTKAVLVKMFGVTFGTITSILRRSTWGHID